jgi:hypothetical protein
MRILKMEIKVEYDISDVYVYHSDFDTMEEPPTIIEIDGKQYEGDVSFKKNGDNYEIIITPRKT